MKKYKHVDEEACKYMGIDPDKAESCCKRIARAAKELEGMGLSLFGGCFAQGSVRTIESFFYRRCRKKSCRRPYRFRFVGWWRRRRI